MRKSKFAERFRNLRIENQLTQSKLAKILKVADPIISYYENGSRIPDIEMQIKIADYFKVSVDYLLGLSDYRNMNEVELINNILNQYNHYLDDLSVDEKSMIIHTVNVIIDSLHTWDSQPSSREKFTNKLYWLIFNSCFIFSDTEIDDIKFTELNKFSEMSNEEKEKYYIEILHNSSEYKDNAIKILQDIYEANKEEIKRRYAFYLNKPYDHDKSPMETNEKYKK